MAAPQKTPMTLDDNTFLSQSGFEVETLTNFCREHSLPMPEFQTILEQGAAHDPKFTVRCYVSRYVIDATARRKKLAKQEAALKMLNWLRSTIDPRVNRKIKTKLQSIHVENFEEAMKVFPHCQLTFNTKYHSQDLGHSLMRDFERFQVYRDIMQEAFDEFGHLAVENPEQALDCILEKAGIVYRIIPVETKSCEDYLVVLNIQFSPDLYVHEMGNSYVDAFRKVAQKGLNYMESIIKLEKKQNQVEKGNVNNVVLPGSSTPN